MIRNQQQILNNYVHDSVLSERLKKGSVKVKSKTGRDKIKRLLFYNVFNDF